MKTARRSQKAQRARAPVRLTLSCGWCAREVTDVEGEQDLASGRVMVAAAPSGFRLSGGRPVCDGCGGPLFLADWMSIHSRPDRGPSAHRNPDDPVDKRPAA